jgi:hypothetical protein
MPERSKFLEALVKIIAASDGAPRGAGLYEEGFNTIGGCEYAAHLIFREILRRHGGAEARRIFGKYAPPKKAGWLKNQTLLDAYDLLPLPIGGNVQQLAKRVAAANKEINEANKRRPPNKQLMTYGRGSTSMPTIEHHIRELLKQRRGVRRRPRLKKR